MELSVGSCHYVIVLIVIVDSLLIVRISFKIASLLFSISCLIFIILSLFFCSKYPVHAWMSLLIWLDSTNGGRVSYASQDFSTTVLALVNDSLP